MSLVSDPPACALPNTGGIATHQLYNTGKERLVFKVKSSNNADYRITPVFGFVDPDSSSPLEIKRLNGSVKEDKLVIHYGISAADAADATAAFGATAASPAGTVIIFLSAEAYDPNNAK